MDIFNQLIRYPLSISLMIPMLGAALIVAPVSLDRSWRIIRSWSRTTMKIFGIVIEVECQLRFTANANGKSELNRNDDFFMYSKLD